MSDRNSTDNPAAPAPHPVKSKLNTQDRLNIQIAMLHGVLAMLEQNNAEDAGNPLLNSAEMVLRESIESLNGIGDEISQLELLVWQAREAVQ